MVCAAESSLMAYRALVYPSKNLIVYGWLPPSSLTSSCLLTFLITDWLAFDYTLWSNLSSSFEVYTPSLCWHKSCFSTAASAPALSGVCCFRLDVQQKSTLLKFILAGFPSSQLLQVFLFVFFLSVYVLSHGQSLYHCACEYLPSTPPPYVLFSLKFAFLEVWFTTACVPKTLANLVSQSQSISFTLSDVLCPLIWLYRVFLPSSAAS